MKKTTTTNTGCLIALPNSTNANAISLFIYFNLFNTCCVVGDERKLPKTRRPTKREAIAASKKQESQKIQSAERERRLRLCCCCCLSLVLNFCVVDDLTRLVGCATLFNNNTKRRLETCERIHIF